MATCPWFSPKDDESATVSWLQHDSSQLSHSNFKTSNLFAVRDGVESIVEWRILRRCGSCTLFVEVSWCVHLQLYHECLLEGARGHQKVQCTAWGNDREMDRAGPGGFVASRMLRIKDPLVLWIQVYWPPSSHNLDQIRWSFPEALHQKHHSETGDQWFTHQLRHPVAKFAPSPAVYRVISIDQQILRISSTWPWRIRIPRWANGRTCSGRPHWECLKISGSRPGGAQRFGKRWVGWCTTCWWTAIYRCFPGQIHSLRLEGLKAGYVAGLASLQRQARFDAEQHCPLCLCLGCGSCVVEGDAPDGIEVGPSVKCTWERWTWHEKVTRPCVKATRLAMFGFDSWNFMTYLLWDETKWNVYHCGWLHNKLRRMRAPPDITMAWRIRSCQAGCHQLQHQHGWCTLEKVTGSASANAGVDGVDGSL